MIKKNVQMFLFLFFKDIHIFIYSYLMIQIYWIWKKLAIHKSHIHTDATYLIIKLYCFNKLKKKLNYVFLLTIYHKKKNYFNWHFFDYFFIVLIFILSIIALITFYKWWRLIVKISILMPYYCCLISIINLFLFACFWLFNNYSRFATVLIHNF